MVNLYPTATINKIKAEYNTSPTRFRKKPIEYILEYFGTPWQKQIDICNDFVGYPGKVLARSGHKIGKTWLNACLAGYAYECEGPCRVLVTGPTSASVTDTIFSELRIHRPRLPGMRPKDSYADRRPGWELVGITGSSSESFQGRHVPKLYMIFDEATGIHKVYFEAGSSMFQNVDGTGGGWVCTYNPLDTTSYVYFLEMLDQWKLHVISQLDHPNITAELAGLPPPYPSAVRLETMINMLDEHGIEISEDEGDVESALVLKWADGRIRRWVLRPEGMARICGEWPTDGVNTLWSTHLWNMMIDYREPEVDPRWKVQIGCDVARYGDDDTTIFVRKGPCLMEYHELHGKDTVEVADYLKALAWQWKPEGWDEKDIPVLVDGIGVGGGVVDQGIKSGFKFIDVNSSHSSAREDCYNFRAELWKNGVDSVKAQTLDVSRIPMKVLNRLRAELMATRYNITPSDKILVEPKRNIKERIKRSPDCADCFNITAYWVH